MPDISKINALAIGSVAKVDGLAKASILDIDGVAVPTGLILDTSAGANSTHAYSVRLLRSAYSGNCLRVRRSSDSTTQDIGFVNGLVDLASISSFCGASDGFVDLWYDQSPGTQVNAPQTAGGAQPKIYDGTLGIIDENGKPALFCPTGLYGFDFGSDTINTTGSGSSFILARNTNLETINYVTWSNSSSTQSIWGGTFAAATGIGYNSSTGTPSSGGYYSTIEDTTTQHTSTVNTVATSNTLFVDGSLISGTSTNVSSFSTQYLGYRTLSSLAFTGHLQEMIFFSGSKSTTEASDLHDNAANYYGF